MITQINIYSEALVDLTLKDAAGRQVKIFHLCENHIAGLKEGDKIWLFDLSASFGDLGRTTWRHPLNFHEFNDRKSDRAWSLQVFSE
jgi:hypothetical protein